MTRVLHVSSVLSFPSAQEPEWAGQVERWYQLDAAAFALTETYWRHRELLKETPDWLFLSSPGASNATDAAFAAQAAVTTPSPAKFVHTLPNVRSASLLKVMGWSGQVLCVQNDPRTVLTALLEGGAMSRFSGDRIWAAAVFGPDTRLEAHIFIIGGTRGDLRLKPSEGDAVTGRLPSDRDFFSWLNGSEQHPFNFVAPALEMVKSPSLK